MARTSREPAPAAEDLPPRVPVVVAGLVVAAAAMLGVQVLYMVLSGAPPAWLPFVALLLVVSVPTAGTAVAWLGARVSRGASEGRAALVFAALGLVAGALWGSLLAGGLAAQLEDAGATGGAGLVLGAAVVTGITGASEPPWGGPRRARQQAGPPWSWRSVPSWSSWRSSACSAERASPRDGPGRGVSTGPVLSCQAGVP
ncbi:hypothetical protein [Cellulosimicrobium sp. CUA-896]|uniref:hypothetical protein n=1 Tax=Cellulosimicrobium sp. CUA-896 TaxID=1517881 RepID=UPI000966D760|nr:hypothetical protein [Cellulosimicrobium sp. CUA-896]OLT55316.1 hypothetical protein BJF88_06700 [Cellulosimicrobium sp. CUA-896]